MRVQLMRSSLQHLRALARAEVPKLSIIFAGKCCLQFVTLNERDAY